MKASLKNLAVAGSIIFLSDISFSSSCTEDLTEVAFFGSPKDSEGLIKLLAHYAIDKRKITVEELIDLSNGDITANLLKFKPAKIADVEWAPAKAFIARSLKGGAVDRGRFDNLVKVVRVKSSELALKQAKAATETREVFRPLKISDPELSADLDKSRQEIKHADVLIRSKIDTLERRENYLHFDNGYTILKDKRGDQLVFPDEYAFSKTIYNLTRNKKIQFLDNVKKVRASLAYQDAIGNIFIGAIFDKELNIYKLEEDETLVKIASRRFYQGPLHEFRYMGIVDNYPAIYVAGLKESFLKNRTPRTDIFLIKKNRIKRRFQGDQRDSKPALLDVFNIDNRIVTVKSETNESSGMANIFIHDVFSNVFVDDVFSKTTQPISYVSRFLKAKIETITLKDGTPIVIYYGDQIQIMNIKTGENLSFPNPILSADQPHIYVIGNRVVAYLYDHDLRNFRWVQIYGPLAVDSL